MRRAAGCFDRIIVSTDDEEIAALARSHGAEVPFLRPAYLADDLATTQSVVLHAIQWCEQQSLVPQAVCCLYATAPFMQPADLMAGRQLLEQSPSGSFVFTATSFSFPIQRAIQIDAAGRSAMFYPEHFNTRSQDLEEAFHDAGQFYWARPEAWTANLNVFDDGRPLILPAGAYRILTPRRIGFVLSFCISFWNKSIHKMSKVILVIVAHPDDEVFGCVGTIVLTLVISGMIVATLMMSLPLSRN